MYRRVRSDLEEAVRGWHDNWPRMAAQLIVSAVLGQGVFWKIGYDQLSVGGKDNRLMQVGFGQKVGRLVYRRLPHTRRTLYAVKAAEVLSDLGKCYTEGLTYDRYGLAPDAVAAAVTQPAWSLIEAVEKLYSLAKTFDRYRQVDEEEFVVAISCIYGSFFRYGQAAVLLAVGDYIDSYVTVPLEKAIRRHPVVILSAALGLAAAITWRVTRAYQESRA